MTRNVVVAPQAEAQIRTIDAWWRENRPGSPRLFEEELAESFATIGIAPHIGRSFRRARVRGVRRVLLRVSRHHVYYVVGRQAVVVVAVWGSVKGAGPDLSHAG